jgi:hypothetical protein
MSGRAGREEAAVPGIHGRAKCRAAAAPRTGRKGRWPVASLRMPGDPGGLFRRLGGSVAPVHVEGATGRVARPPATARPAPARIGG